MRMSKLFFKTLRETPAGAEITSHQLLIQAGFVRPLISGSFDFLPLGLKVTDKIDRILREEMDAIGGQEVSLPVVHPAEVWQKSGRWDVIGDDMARLKDRHERDMCLGMTHEEVMAEMVSQIVTSYKQLPLMLYQLQTKFRDEPRPRGGLIRTREFVMKDGYSFHVDEEDFDRYYPTVYEAYFKMFERCGLDVIAVESDNGIMGGDRSHEYMALTPVGEDTILICDSCDYKANRQVATMQKPEVAAEELQALEKIATPDTTTIAKLAEFLGIPESRTAKAVFMVAETDEAEQFVFVVLRGDMDLSETKLSNTLKARSLRPATAQEIKAIGAEPGYGSPVGIKREQVMVVVDDLIARAPNLVAGANEVGYHYQNVNFGRDYSADIVKDIAAASEGDACPECGAAMKAVRGVEVGNIFKLGTKFSEALGATFLDENGESQAAYMGSYGIGPARLLACVVELNHDDKGIIWPASIAPYQVSLLSLVNQKQPELLEQVEDIYARLTAHGLEVLFDERDERAGVKFNDAELLGIPVRVTLGRKGLEKGLAEVSIRRTGEQHDVALADLENTLTAMLTSL